MIFTDENYFLLPIRNVKVWKIFDEAQYTHKYRLVSHYEFSSELHGDSLPHHEVELPDIDFHNPTIPDSLILKLEK